MKLFTTCSSKSTYVLKLASIGMTLTILAVLLLLCDPVKLIVDWQLTLRAGSILYNLWLKPPIDVFISVYLFNITNLDEFVRGVDLKLKVVEVGPYVYQEVLTNYNVTFNANDTVTYTPRREVSFVPEKSMGDPKVDRIIAPNIPYMGATTIVAEMSTIAALGMSALTTQMKTKPLLMMSVHEYLWGYEDNLVQLAAKFVPSFIPFKKFGILERLFDEGNNELTMKLPSKIKKVKQNKAKHVAENKEKLRDYALDNWNGEETIKYWSTRYENSTQCNSIHGSYDGTLFPQDIKKGDTFRIYRKAFCRNLPITFSHPGYVDGMEAYHFKLDKNAFDSDLNNVNSSCFCSKRKCLKQGLGNITPCYFNMPLAISLPHFLNADPSLLKSVEGLTPDELKHSSEVILQPQLGIPMRVHTRFQVNLLIDDVKFNREVSRFRNTVLPILWTEISVNELKPQFKILLTLLFKICPYVQCGIIIILIVAGLSLVGASLFQWVAVPTAAAIPSSNGGIIIFPSDPNVVNNDSHNGCRKFKKAQKQIKTMTKKQPPPAGGVTKTNVCIVPVRGPQQPQLEHHYQREEELQQLLQKDSSTLPLPEFMT